MTTIDAKVIEVERRFPIYNSSELARWLDQNAEPDKKSHQHDTYFRHPTIDYLAKYPVTKWLRLRRVQGSEKGVFTYKDWGAKDVGSDVSCLELNVEVGNANMFQNLLLHQGYNVLIVLEKSRSTWIYQNTELAIDDVVGLGTYLEIEAKGCSNVEQGKQYIDDVLIGLRRIGVAMLDLEDFKGYPMLLLNKQGLVK